MSEKDKESQPTKVVEALRKDLRKIYGSRVKFKENTILDSKKPFYLVKPFYLISTEDRTNIGLEELEQIFKEEWWSVPKKIIRTISADARFWHKTVCGIMRRDLKEGFLIAGSEMAFKVKMSNHFFTLKHLPENEIRVSVIDPQQKNYSLVLIEKIDQLGFLKIKI